MVSRELKEINGVRWVALAFQSNAVDTEIINNVLMTALDNGLVTFNFNSTVGEHRSHASMLEESRQSIRVLK